MSKFGKNKPEMRNITVIEGGYWVRFQRKKELTHQTFNARAWGSIERALTEAQIWRNAIERELGDIGGYYVDWSDGFIFYIVGLTWTQRLDTRDRFTNQIQTRNSRPLKPKYSVYHTYSITEYGLKGAFDKAVSGLEKEKLGKPYPLKVKSRALRLLKHEYKLLSIADTS